MAACNIITSFPSHPRNSCQNSRCKYFPCWVHGFLTQTGSINTKTPKSEGKRGQKGAEFFLYVIYVSSTCSEEVFIPLTFFTSFQKCSWSPGIFMEYSGCRVITWRRECTNCLLLLGHVSHAILKVMVAFGSNLRGRPSPSDIHLLPLPVWNSLRMLVTFAFQPSQHSSNSSSCS